MPRYLSAEEAQRLDRELMDPASGCGFTLAQLMELAGLSVAQVVHDAYPSLRRILVVAGRETERAVGQRGDRSNTIDFMVHFRSGE